MRFIDRIKAAVRRGPARWESIKQVPASVDKHAGQSASMQRHPYSFEGIDRNGQPKAGETLMRDKTLAAMMDGFYDAGYQFLIVRRDGEKAASFSNRGNQRQPS